jgi:tetratricopeptide (TPR) repeat protein
LLLGQLPTRADTIPEIVAKAKPAVVEIVTIDQKGSPNRLGTGFFISPDGQVVTNQHVVESAASIAAINNNGAMFQFERVVAQPAGVDLAILKFRATDVPFLTLGKSTTAVEGQKVIVIGNPTGLTGTVSDGIISAFREDRSLIQITAPISPGSSGSPVMDEEGKVIGVATLQSKVAQNLNFAIPVETLNVALNEIDQKKPLTPLADAAFKRDVSEDLAPEVARAKQLAPHDPSGAFHVLKDYLAKNPKDAQAWGLYAESCWKMFRTEEATDAAQKAVECDPDNLDWWRVLVFCLAERSNTTDQVLLAKLKQAAEHDLAMGDNFRSAYFALMQAADSAGDKEQSAKLWEQCEQLRKSGELADYAFGREKRYFDNQVMYRADQVAQERGMELTDDDIFNYLHLKGNGHSFDIAKNSNGVRVDGVWLIHDSTPARYKHLAYYIDSKLVDLVFDPILKPKDIGLHLSLIDFRIDTVYFEANLSVPSTEDQRVGTQKLIDAVLKLNPRHFKEKTGAAVNKNAVVISLRCRQNNNPTAVWLVLTNPAIPVFHEPISEQQLATMTDAEKNKAVLYSEFAAEARTMMANLLQAQLGNLMRKLIDNSYLQGEVSTATSFKWCPNPTPNPTLVIDISLPKSEFNSDSTYEKIAHCLADTVVKVSTEIFGETVADSLRE